MTHEELKKELNRINQETLRLIDVREQLEKDTYKLEQDIRTLQLNVMKEEPDGKKA